MEKTIDKSKWNNKLPPEKLSFKSKNRSWRKAHLDWADNKTFFNYNPVRKSVIHKKINYDLINGKLHMQDVELLLNPEQLSDKTTPETIQHYSIMNSKLNVLRGEELARTFDYRVVITNPTALSERENERRDQIYQALQKLVQDQSSDEQQFQQKLQSIQNYFIYEWQDFREVRANQLLNHYVKEYNLPILFNRGFMDALTVGEEIYQCDIVGCEPVITRINPLKIRVFRSGFSNRIEDADVIILEDYWSPGKVQDAFYDQLTSKDMDYLQNGNADTIGSNTNEVGERDDRYGFVNRHMIDDVIVKDDFYFDPFNLFSDGTDDLLPFDTNGNVRVIQMYWKSKRKIKKVRSFDQETGDIKYDFYPETYVIDKDAGEEETIYYINEAWEGTKIGQDIYVNMRPRPVQYNRLGNPSRCHFGIIGSIYNFNDSRPYSLVDIMKPYAYLYDVVHDRLNKLMAKNWGKMIVLDLAKVPAKWDIDKWLYYAKHNNLIVVDSFKEGNYGAATGKLAGAMNNASSGVVDAELGNVIASYIQTLEYIKTNMSDLVGVSRQREGQIANRETVGGVERATLQSSHITEWLFAEHDDVKKRALECFLETAKIALKGQNLKFQYILSDGSIQLVEIDGDEFAECDYGLVVDNSEGIQKLTQQMETLAQAALQNQKIRFSTLFKLYSTASLMEKQKLVEKDEQDLEQQQQQQFQQQMELQQRQLQQQAQQAQQELEQKESANIRDNQTKLQIADITAQSQTWIEERKLENESAEKIADDKLKEQIREFDQKMKLEKEKLQHQDKWHQKSNNNN